MHGLRIITSIVLMLITGLTVANPAYAGSQQININVGENKVITVESLDRVAVGDSDIADVKALSDGKQLLITGKSKGTTNLILWTSSGEETRTIKVVSVDPKKVFSDVSQLLQEVEGISVTLVGDYVIVDGETITGRDYERVQKVANLYPQVKTLLQRGYGQSELYVAEINKALSKAGLVGVEARTTGTKIFLEGNVATKDDLKNASSIAEAFIDKPSEDLVNIVKVGGSRTIIQMNLEFVEINKTDLKNLGVKWGDALDIGASASISGPLGPVSGPRTFGGPLNISANYGVALNLMKQKGTARILAKPKVMTVSGQKATFLAGGEVPIPLITANSSTVQYKEFGLRFIFEPEANPVTGDVYSKIEVEMSDIDRSTNVQGVPGFLTRRVDTYLAAKSGQTVALSGLIRAETSKTVNKMPGFGSIPILGELFKSRKFNERQSELVVFVTPHIIESGDQKNIEIVEQGKASYEKADKDVKFSILD